MKLPELPEPAMVYINATGHTTRCHNETQLIEYGRACAEAMREACANAAEGHYGDGHRLAHEIRALEIEE